MDKYLTRETLPFPWDEGLFEVRLLTVDPRWRHTAVAGVLAYAATRWVESRGATRLMAIGRHEVMPLYRRMGLQPLGVTIASGAVRFEAMTMTRQDWRAVWAGFADVLSRWEERVCWELDIPFRAPAPCFHGGAFFEAVGDEFRTLDSAVEVVNADVLDAWFPPSPAVLQAIHDHLPWLARTSPPTGAEGLVRVIARARGVPIASVLPGAGSSSLIFMALCHWLTPESRALILDPTYGEYAHVLGGVIGCRVDTFPLARCEDYDVDLDRLAELAPLYDFVVLVNPNSPTGRHITRSRLEATLRCVPASVRVWVDETYVEYAGAGESLERFAVARPNIVVCKSMSKAYALSGLRVACLCAAPHVLEPLRAVTPPWSVGLLAQVAAVRAEEQERLARMRGMLADEERRAAGATTNQEQR
jgi:histidinol-phosphate/aromatic aminotransferase/cobyric acid decarboxylase-like protein